MNAGLKSMIFGLSTCQSRLSTCYSRLSTISQTPIPHKLRLGIAQKPMNANLRLKVNQGVYFSSPRRPNIGIGSRRCRSVGCRFFPIPFALCLQSVLIETESATGQLLHRANSHRSHQILTSICQHLSNG